MNKRLMITTVAAIAAGMALAHPGPGGFRGGPGPGGFRGGPPPMRGPGPGFHGHRHCGWGVAGAVIGTAAIVRDIVRPAPVVVAPPPPPVYAPAPVVVAPAPVVYAPPPPPPPPPPPCRFW